VSDAKERGYILIYPAAARTCVCILDRNEEQGVVVDDGVADQPGALVPDLALSIRET
jgi:hypothetical protein